MSTAKTLLGSIVTTMRRSPGPSCWRRSESYLARHAVGEHVVVIRLDAGPSANVDVAVGALQVQDHQAALRSSGQVPGLRACLVERDLDLAVLVQKPDLRLDGGCRLGRWWPGSRSRPRAGRCGTAVSRSWPQSRKGARRPRDRGAKLASPCGP